MKNLFLFLLLGLTFSLPAQNLPKASWGTIHHLENFKSQYLASRNIDVWIPDGYSTSKKYAVVYMHDGQMLFDTAQAWNRKEWKVDETLSLLTSEKKILNCIVVGIWNNGTDRIAEYFPNKIFDLLGETTKKNVVNKFFNGKKAMGDQYLSFIVKELKPYIDTKYSTFTDREHTFMVGSSMGGLISVYAICEYPDVFKGIASLSTAWLSQIDPGYEIPSATFNYLKDRFPASENHLIYMDYGTGESDKGYETTQSFVDFIAKGKGYTDKNYRSKVFEKAGHNEVAWSERLNVPFEFLLMKMSQ